jgi:hypothetical protein
MLIRSSRWISEGQAKMPKATPAKRRAKPQPTFVTYALSIDAWKPEYAIWIAGKDAWDRRLHHEFATVELTTTAIHPLKLKGQPATVHMHGERALAHRLASLVGESSDHVPLGVASLTWREGRGQLLWGPPYDAIPMITQCLSIGRIRYLIGHGAPLRYGSTMLHSIRLSDVLDEDEL